MRRYYLARIVGSGTQGDPYRAKAANYGVNHVASVPTDAITGAPLKGYALLLVDAADHAALLGDADLDALPNVALTKALTKAQRDAIVQQASSRLGLTITLGSGATLGDAVTAIGQALDGAHFTVERFGVG